MRTKLRWRRSKISWTRTETLYISLFFFFTATQFLPAPSRFSQDWHQESLSTTGETTLLRKAMSAPAFELRGSSLVRLSSSTVTGRFTNIPFSIWEFLVSIKLSFNLPSKPEAQFTDPSVLHIRREIAIGTTVTLTHITDAVSHSTGKCRIVKRSFRFTHFIWSERKLITLTAYLFIKRKILSKSAFPLPCGFLLSFEMDYSIRGEIKIIILIDLCWKYFLNR